MEEKGSKRGGWKREGERGAGLERVKGGGGGWKREDEREGVEERG